MSLTISCPACRRTLRVPENLIGKGVKCPGCSHRFTAAEQSEEKAEAPRRSSAVSEKPSRRPATPPPEEEDDAPPPPRRSSRDDDDERSIRRSAGSSRSRREEDDEYDDEEREPSPRDVKAGWDKVRMGINLVMIGLWVWIGSSVLAALGGILGMLLIGGTIMSNVEQPNIASLGFSGLLVILAAGLYYLGAFAEFVLRMIGYGLCMAVPVQRRGGLKPMAIAAFSLSGASVLFTILSLAVGGFNGLNSFNSFNNRANVDVAGSSISLLNALCAFASFVVYLFFLRGVCTNVRARELTGKPISVLIAFVCFALGAVVLFVIMLCAGAGAIGSAMQSQTANRAAASIGTWFILFAILVAIMGLAYMGLNVWYITVLQKIRDAVASYRRRL